MEGGGADVKCDYAININIEKYKYNDLPDNLVLFFESDLGWNGVGGKNDVNYSNHNGKAGIITVDGHIFLTQKEVVEGLQWE